MELGKGEERREKREERREKREERREKREERRAIMLCRKSGTVAE